MGLVTLTAFHFFFAPLVSLATDLTVPVISIIDGDTIEVLPSAGTLHNRRTKRIYLHYIDCPEKGHAYGNRAKQATSDIVFSKTVTVAPPWS